jgi:hypothetical protein
MFDRDTISTNLYGIVGLRQSYNPDYAILDTDNTTSRSTYYANESNPYVKIEYIKDTQDYVDISDADFNQLIKQIQQSAITETCAHIFDKPDFRQSALVYDNAINKVNTTTLQDGFVCYKILVTRDNNVAFKINNVRLDFLGTGDITLQLYSSQQQEPLYEQLITITSTTQTEQLGWVVNNLGNTGKGEYYLGYITNSDLTPFKRDYKLSDILTCYTDLWVYPYQFKGHNTNVIPDLTQNDGLSDYMGVNPDITVYDDYTDFIIREEMLLAPAINMMFQIALLRPYLGSLRSNKNERNASDLYLDINRHLEGLKQDGVVHIRGLREIYATEITRVKKEIEKMKKGFFGGKLMNQTIT